MSRQHPTVSAVLSPLRERWRQLAHRERTLIATAAVLIGTTLLWWVGVAPALRTLRQASDARQQLDGQIQHMQALQAQAVALQASPRLPDEGAARALETTVRQRLGQTGQLSVAGERATLTLKGVSPDALAQWLAEARVNARAVPIEVRLTRTPGSGPASWNGTMVLSLPQPGARP